jgi:hypothetical protein
MVAVLQDPATSGNCGLHQLSYDYFPILCVDSTLPSTFIN